MAKIVVSGPFRARARSESRLKSGSLRGEVGAHGRPVREDVLRRAVGDEVGDFVVGIEVGGVERVADAGQERGGPERERGMYRIGVARRKERVALDRASFHRVRYRARRVSLRREKGARGSRAWSLRGVAAN